MQDLWIRHESRMLIGVPATYFEIDTNLFIHGTADLDNKLVKILENKRRDVTVETYLKLINHEHLERVGILYWLWTLVSNIPVLKVHPVTVETYLKLINHKHLERVGILHWLRTLVSNIPVLKVHPLAMSDYHNRAERHTFGLL